MTDLAAVLAPCRDLEGAKLAASLQAASQRVTLTTAHADSPPRRKRGTAKRRFKSANPPTTRSVGGPRVPEKSTPPSPVPSVSALPPTMGAQAQVTQPETHRRPESCAVDYPQVGDAQRGGSKTSATTPGHPALFVSLPDALKAGDA